MRGHRVSSCTHADRKLLHVNKKGRPVSQCPHCRSLRKNRSQHVKCECHDKSHAKEDCPHLKDIQEGASGSASATNTCCCGHGARCTCSLKKEPYLDTVPEDLTQILAHQKEPRTQHRGPNHNNHDSKPTVFTNGHHKPVHKFNDAHNHCGAPYRIPSRSNSHHGHREIAQRSTDSLPSTSSRPPSTHVESPLHSVMAALQPSRQARSEHNSPLLAPTSAPTSAPNFPVEIPPLSPNDYSYSPFKTQSPGSQPQPHLPETIPENWFTTHDEAHNYGPPSVPELAYIDWSKYGFGGTPTLDNNGMQPLYPMDPTAGFSNQQYPGFAPSIDQMAQFNSSGFNTSSAELSEVEDMPQAFRPSTLRTISHASNDVSSTGATDDGESHRLSSASSYFGTPAGNMLASNMEDLDIDKFINEQKQKQNLKNQAFATQQSLSDFPAPLMQQNPQQNVLQQQPTPPQSHTMSTPPESIRGFSITSHPSPGDSDNEPQIPYSIAEAQNYAHMPGNDIQHSDKVQMMQHNAVYEDPMWGGSNVDQYGNKREFSLDDPKEDDIWAR